MAKRFNFTQKRLDEITKSPDQAEFYDEQIRNLTVRRSTKNLSFYVRRKVKGQGLRVYIGRYPEMSIEQARKKASEVLFNIANESLILPTEKRLQESLMCTDPVEAPKIPTVYELFELYISNHAAIHCIRHEEMRKDFKRYVWDWRNRPHTSITKLDVLSRFNAVRQKNGPMAANHLLILMRAALNWNIRNGVIETNPWSGVKQNKIQPRERFLMPNEMNAFFAALKQEDETFQDYVLISLYTGARRTNVLEMRWEDINFQLAVWRIPKTKNKESHYVPLTSSAMDLLRRRWEARTNIWVFPGKKPGSHLVEPMKAWRRMLKKAGITDLRLHDLRRTLGSYMAMSNQNIKIISQALGHKSMASTEIYTKLMHDPVRLGMESAETQIRKYTELDVDDARLF
ncbi:MAG: DUF4102 domain-containing protein [Candidatus Melainabacteria bacterium]|nr:MAG: DUF4102 domain-containing protein [Candidatus Melainabacteria bacterium]